MKGPMNIKGTTNWTGWYKNFMKLRHVFDENNLNDVNLMLVYTDLKATLQT